MNVNSHIELQGQLETFTEIIQNILKSCLKLQTFQYNSKISWWNENLISQRNKVTSLYKRFKK